MRSNFKKIFKKEPQNNKRYEWTLHAKEKMRFYNLSESRVLRVLRFPKRIEWGIAPNTIAMMQPSISSKNPYEIWVMYQEVGLSKNQNKQSLKNICKKRIITAWRYPGKSPKGNPIPEDILLEIKKIIY